VSRRRLPTERTALGNRIGLVLVGLVLVVASSAALAGPSGPILPRQVGALGAWWWAVAGGVAVLTLVCLRWALVQGRRDGFAAFAVEDDPRRGLTRVPTHVLAQAVEEDLRSIPGVAKASAAFVGWPSEPQLRLSVGLEEGADLDAVRAEVAAGVVGRLCQALELEAIPVLLGVQLDAAHPSARR